MPLNSKKKLIEESIPYFSPLEIVASYIKSAENNDEELLQKIKDKIPEGKKDEVNQYMMIYLKKENYSLQAVLFRALCAVYFYSSVFHGLLDNKRPDYEEILNFAFDINEFIKIAVNETIKIDKKTDNVLNFKEFEGMAFMSIFFNEWLKDLNVLLK